MIYFITEHYKEYQSKIDTVIHPDIRVISPSLGIGIFTDKVKGKKKVCLDVETNGLDPYSNDVLLTGIKVSNTVYIIDSTINIDNYIDLIKDRLIIGQNLKFDIKMLHKNGEVQLRKLYDTMVAEQRIFMGMSQSNSLAEIVQRYLNIFLPKEDQTSFIGKSKESFRASVGQLKYLERDLIYLEAVRAKQIKFIKQYSMEFLLYGIEFPLISIVANAELEGFVLDTNSWLETVKLEEQNNYKILCELDEIFKELREFANTYGGTSFLNQLQGGKYDNKRNFPTLIDHIDSKKNFKMLDLFGNITVVDKRKTSKAVLYPNNINWSSPKEIQTIAGMLGMNLPMEKGYEVPRLNPVSGALVYPTNTFKLGKDRLHGYLEEENLSELEVKFFKKYIEFNASSTNLQVFGRNFIEKVSPVTGRIHTTFRTATANTGRMQSGGGKREPDKFNAQNIPALENYRIPFSADKEHYDILTADYTGAELIVMASHAQDFKLIEISKGDMHTYMGNRMWRRVFRYRAKDKYDEAKELKFSIDRADYLKIVQDYKALVKKAVHYEIDPSERKGCKPMTFGTIYGMYGAKAEKTMKLHKGEGNEAIAAIKEEIPKTFAMVEAASAFAKANGYIIHNSRTNSRRWFPVLIDRLKGVIEEKANFGFISKAMSEARNTRIQGTQADFVKEASVVLDKVYNRVKLTHEYRPKILSWVHDEFVIKLPINKELAEPYYYEGKEYTNLVDLTMDILVLVANRYLNNITISCDYKIEKTWIK